MKAQDLKNSILQLAVQGKLVPQNPSEAPASELLKEIKAEKERLIKSGKIKKDKVLAPIADMDIPFQIPASWEYIKVGDICQLLDGEKLSGKKYPYLEAKYLRGKTEATLFDNGKFIYEGTKVILVDGENSGEVFTVAESGYMGSTFKVLFITEAMFHDYVLMFLTLRKMHFRNNKTGSAIPHLNKELFFNMPIPIPPLAEQKRIVARIEALLPLVAEYDAAENRLTELNSTFLDKLRKSILQQAVQGKLTERAPADEPASELLKRIKTEKEQLIKEGKLKKEKPLPPIAEDEIPFEIPENWMWVRLGSISDMCLGKMLDKAKNKGTMHPYLRNVNVRWGFFDFSDILEMRFTDDEEERYSVRYGDLVVCEGGEPGRCSVWNNKGATFRIQKALHRIRFYGKLNSFYLCRVFEAYTTSGYMSHFFTGATIKHLPGVVLQKLLIPLPPLAEQERIVARVDELLALCDEMQ